MESSRRKAAEEREENSFVKRSNVCFMIFIYFFGWVPGDGERWLVSTHQYV